MTTLRDRVLGGETTFGTWLSTGSPVVAEACGRAGFDWLVIDTEHGMSTETTVLGQLYAIGTTAATALVRIERSDRLRISRALDMGAGRPGGPAGRLGRRRPRRPSSWMRFPPEGQRGIALGGRGQGFGRVGHADIGTLNDVVAGRLPDRERGGRRGRGRHRGPARRRRPLRRAGRPVARARRPGPLRRSDLPRRRQGGRRRACERHGKAAGILLYDRAVIARHLELGFRFIGLGSDLGFVAAGARGMVEAARGG